MRKRWIALFLCLTLLPVCPVQAQEEKLIALTFDDGPGPYTGQLLDVLEENRAKATFFVLGCNMERYPDALRRAYDEGHQLANHTYSHEVLTGRTDAQALEQVQKTARLLDEVCGVGAGYVLRPPCGEFNKHLLKELNYPAVLWSVDTMDWRDKDAKLVAKRIVDGAYDGAIILCHDLYHTTVEAVALAVKELGEQGYAFVTVNEMFRRRGVSMKTGVAYNKCRPTGTLLPAVTPPQIVVAPDQNAASVVLSAQEGAKIYYTTDGTTPTAQSHVYDGPILLRRSGTICAVAAYEINGSRSEPVRQAVEVTPDPQAK